MQKFNIFKNVLWKLSKLWPTLKTLKKKKKQHIFRQICGCWLCSQFAVSLPVMHTAALSRNEKKKKNDCCCTAGWETVWAVIYVTASLAKKFESRAISQLKPESLCTWRKQLGTLSTGVRISYIGVFVLWTSTFLGAEQQIHGGPSGLKWSNIYQVDKPLRHALFSKLSRPRRCSILTFTLRWLRWPGNSTVLIGLGAGDAIWWWILKRSRQPSPKQSHSVGLHAV